MVLKSIPKKDIGLAVVIDIQEGYSKIIHNGSNEMFLANVKEVLEYFNKKGTEVIFVEYADSGMILPEVYDIIEVPNKKTICTKYTTSAFNSGDFTKVLEKKSQTVEYVLMLGLENNYCLLETVRHALISKYNIVVSYDLMTGSDHLYDGAEKIYNNCYHLTS